MVVDALFQALQILLKEQMQTSFWHDDDLTIGGKRARIQSYGFRFLTCDRQEITIRRFLQGLGSFARKILNYLTFQET